MLIALALHVTVVPRMFLPLMQKGGEAPVEVEYVEVPNLDDKAAPDEKPEDKKADADKAAQPPKVAKLDEVKPAPPPTPEPKKEEPKPEEKKEPPKQLALPKPPPPPPPQPPPPKMVMVDQDKFPEEKENAEAKYLAQKNHRAKRDTRTLATNLVREHDGGKQAPTAPSLNEAPNVGMPKEKIAELQKQKGTPKELVRGNPRLGEGGKGKVTLPGKLAMRGLTPYAPDKAQDKPREGLELSDADHGPLPAQRQGKDQERAGSRAAGTPLGRQRFELKPEDYDKIVGESVAANERRAAAKAEPSHPGGRWDKLAKKVAMMRSSLENFTPDAHVGSEAELGTRAHPFAAYIAEMHRGIHKMWAFNFLGALDNKGALDPYNDMERWVQVGVVLSGEGVVEKVLIERPSGYLPFDTAAMDAVMSCSPFPTPPETIKSVDGKVYLSWRFHRDDRQCGTFGVDPHILTAVPAEKQHG